MICGRSAAGQSFGFVFCIRREYVHFYNLRTVYDTCGRCHSLNAAWGSLDTSLPLAYKSSLLFLSRIGAGLPFSRQVNFSYCKM